MTNAEPMKNENPWIEICPGIKRRTQTSGKTMYQMVATLEAGSKMPEHRHPQEQIVHILEIATDVRIGIPQNDDGVPRRHPSHVGNLGVGASIKGDVTMCQVTDVDA